MVMMMMMIVYLINTFENHEFPPNLVNLECISLSAVEVKAK